MRSFLNKYNILSNAKINIGLNVFKKDSDGYHNIDSIMAPIDLADELEITFFDEVGDLKIECTDKKIPTDDKNILYKTYKIFFEEILKVEQEKIEVKLIKNIPSEAGLGGGSSNAAFFLLTLCDKYKLKLDDVFFKNIAKRIGSDVPFFLENKTARVSGKGEKIQIIENNLEDSLILIKPNDFGVSTKEAYEKFDKLINVEYSNFDDIIKSLKENKRISLENEIYNGLEQAIVDENINLKMLKLSLNSVLSGKKFFMSGSGSTYYTFVTEKEKSQVETRLKTFVDNVQIIMCNLKK